MSDKFKVKMKDGITAEEIATGLTVAFKKAFGRSFVTKVSEKDGKIVIHAEERDLGQSVMTVEDVAALLQVTRDIVMERTRAEEHPLPFFAVSDKIIRFKREDVIAWMDAAAKRGAVPKIKPPHKGKVIGRKR